MPAYFNPSVQLKVEVGFNSTAWNDTDFAWTDVTKYVQQFDYNSGRQFELDEATAGTASFTMFNSDRRFDPASTGGAYQPNVKVMKPIRLQGIHSGTTYDLWRGYVESWTPRYELDLDMVDVSAVDGFKPLAFNGFFSSTAPVENTGARIDRFLDAAGWTTALRATDTGSISCQAYTADCSAVLKEVQRVAGTEPGLFFMDAGGKATFHDVDYRTASTSIATFTDTGGLPYVEPLERPLNDSQIWNQVTVVPIGIAAIDKSDTGSIDAYGARHLKWFDTLHAASTAADDTAALLLARYKEPETRVPSLTIDPQASTALWPQVLGRGIGDRVTVRQVGRSTTTGVYNADMHIEGVSVFASVEKDWQVQWMLSPSTPLS